MEWLVGKSITSRADLRELVDREHKVAEAQDSFAEAAELKVGLVEGDAPLVSDRLFNTVHQHRRRTINYSLWSALHHQQIPLVLRLMYGYLQKS